ncbi:MAG: hypothetical protein FJ161_02200 [Gammaproteobacteria bacterium]|nr:hypothetical protein [Gammaproteobacteria bacterium]
MTLTHNLIGSLPPPLLIDHRLLSSENQHNLIAGMSHLNWSYEMMIAACSPLTQEQSEDLLTESMNRLITNYLDDSSKISMSKVLESLYKITGHQRNINNQLKTIEACFELCTVLQYYAENYSIEYYMSLNNTLRNIRNGIDWMIESNEITELNIGTVLNVISQYSDAIQKEREYHDPQLIERFIQKIQLKYPKIDQCEEIEPFRQYLISEPKPVVRSLLRRQRNQTNHNQPGNLP